MARISKKQQKERAEQTAHEMANALNIITKPMRTKRIQPRKSLYWLMDATENTTIIALREYDDDLAIQASLRKLSELKRRNTAPERAILVKGFTPEEGEKIQGFRRTNN